MAPGLQLSVFHHRKGLPDDWERIAREHLGAWDTFNSYERDDLAGIADWMLRHKHWEAANHFELNDDITTTIALEASVLLLGLDTDFYREVSAIVVYPTTIMSHGVYAGPARGTVSDSIIPVLGQAHSQRGAILIAWDEVLNAARHPGHGRNVVFHEFAHKLDMLDDLTDGTPPLGSKEQLAHWVEVCTPLYNALREGDDRPPLDQYGGTNVAEFFAVATEAFFDAPVQLETHQHELFEILRGFYKQDPAERAKR